MIAIRRPRPGFARTLHALALLALAAAPGARADSFSQTGILRFHRGQSLSTVSLDAGFGDGFVVGIDAAGHPVGWGANDCGVLDMPSDPTPLAKIAASHFAVAAIAQDGSLRAWGARSLGTPPVPPIGLPPCTAIAGGWDHFLALRNDGLVTGFGNPADGRTSPPAGLIGCVSVAAGTAHSLALLADGSIALWGTGLISTPADLGPCSRLVSGTRHALAIRADGTVAAWGSNTAGQCVVPNDLGPCTDVAAGAGFSSALRADGSVRTWGKGQHWSISYDVAFPDGAALGRCTRLMGGENGLAGVGVDGVIRVVGMDYAPEGAEMDALPARLRTVATAQYFTTVVGEDGSVAVFGCSFLTNDARDFLPVNAPTDLGPVVDAAGGFYHALLLQADGTVRGLGCNRSGEISIPADLAGVVQVAAGIDGSFARLSDGKVRAWGLIASGWGDRTPPTNLPPSAWITAYFNRVGSVGVDGSMRVWGSQSGTPTPPAGLSAVVQAAVGARHAIALRADGMPQAWGSSTEPQGSVPADVGPCRQVAAGGKHNVVLRTDGTVRAWGTLHSGTLLGTPYGGATVPPYQGTATAVYAGPEIVGVFSRPACTGDIDGSRTVDLGDIGLMLLDFGPCVGCGSDLDGDGSVGFGDVALAQLEFGPCD